MITRKTNLIKEACSVPADEIVVDGLILALWRQGLDTYEIASKLWFREHEVANKLWRLRSAGK